MMTAAIYVHGGASSNIIGGDDADDGTVDGIVGARNVISGSLLTVGGTGIGVRIDGSVGVALNNVVRGNFVGTDYKGTTDLGNADDGILLQGPGNTIGGLTAGSGNLISGNNGDGMQINGVQTDGSVIIGDLIGTTADGAAALANSRNGIFITSASNTSIGGTISAPRNVISGNTGFGVEISSASNNTVAGY
jgi:hypothetical protein